MEHKLNDNDIWIEVLGSGFIIADYSGRATPLFGARYRGVSKQWYNRPVITDPFPTAEAAIEAASSLLIPPK